MDTVVHFEIPADDLEQAKRFYGEVFGWQSQDFAPGEYAMAVTTPTGEDMRPTEPGGINGALMKRTEPDDTHPVIVLGVDSIDERLAQVERAGGAVVRPKAPVEEMGWYAYFRDPAGNVMGLWEARKAS